MGKTVNIFLMLYSLDRIIFPPPKLTQSGKYGTLKQKKMKGLLYAAAIVVRSPVRSDFHYLTRQATLEKKNRICSVLLFF